jgi:predicted DsbA family dithiol-disulfide isomerase
MAGPTVRVWSDYICPFCYVGTERARWLEERYGASVEWLPFDLHPEYPAGGISREALDASYGGAEWREELVSGFEDLGLRASREIEVVPNSFKALRLGELARERGVLDELHPRLFDAYWGRGLDLGDDAVLTAEAEATGLDSDEVREVLESDRYGDVVRRRTQEIIQAGGTGVPAFVIDDRILVPGAQPYEVFEQAMDQLGYAPAQRTDADEPGEPGEPGDSAEPADSAE